MRCRASRAPNLTGGVSKMLPNHHITKPVFIGEIKGNGQFDVVWKTPGLVAGDAWSKELPGLQGPDRRLGWQEVRQLQHQDQQVRRSGFLIESLTCQTNQGRRRYPPPSHCSCRGRPVLTNVFENLPRASVRSLADCSRPCCRPWPGRSRTRSANSPTTSFPIRKKPSVRSRPAAIRWPTHHQRAAGRPADGRSRHQESLCHPARRQDHRCRDRRRRSPAFPTAPLPFASTTVCGAHVEAALGGLTLPSPDPGQAHPGRAIGLQDP